MPLSTKRSDQLQFLGGMVGGLAGWLLTHYAGRSIWVPGIATIVLLSLLNTPALRPRYFLWALGITGGHLFWFLFASFVLKDWSAAALDMILLSIGIVWLGLRPGWAPALALGLVDLVSLVFVAVQINSEPFGSLAHKSLAVHGVWRLGAIISLVAGYLKLRRERAEEAWRESRFQARSREQHSV